MKILASAGFSYLLKWILFIVLAVGVNVTLALVYFGNIIELFSGHNILLGLITLGTVIGFPVVWLFMAKKEALLSAIFKVVDHSLDELVAFVIDTFLTKDKRGKISNYTSVLAKQSKVTQLILGFFFEQIDFFGDVARLLEERDYSEQELKVKMVEIIKEKEVFEEWEPSFMTPLFLLLSNVGIIMVAEYFL